MEKMDRLFFFTEVFLLKAQLSGTLVNLLRATQVFTTQCQRSNWGHLAIGAVMGRPSPSVHGLVSACVKWLSCASPPPRKESTSLVHNPLHHLIITTCQLSDNGCFSFCCYVPCVQYKYVAAKVRVSIYVYLGKLTLPSDQNLFLNQVVQKMREFHVRLTCDRTTKHDLGTNHYWIHYPYDNGTVNHASPYHPPVLQITRRIGFFVIISSIGFIVCVQSLVIRSHFLAMCHRSNGNTLLASIFENL